MKNKVEYTYIIGKDGVTVYILGNSYTVTQSHPNYPKIIKAITKGKSEKKLLSLIDRKRVIEDYAQGQVEIKDGVLYYDGEQLHNSLTRKILNMIEDGFDISPMINFLTNLRENPSRVAQQELYDFLEAGDLPITPDGYFLAYKAVRANYKDYYSGKFDNSIGAICEMPRVEVDDDRRNTCSSGLHAAQRSYAENFGGTDGHLMVIKINPRDVVSIPPDYNFTKLRCCRYEVIGETTYNTKVDEYTTKSVYIS